MLRSLKNKTRKHYLPVFFICIIVLLFFIMQQNLNSFQQQRWLQKQELQGFVGKNLQSVSIVNDGGHAFKRIVHPHGKLSFKITSNPSTNNIIPSPKLPYATANTDKSSRTFNEIATMASTTPITLATTVAMAMPHAIATLGTRNLKMGHVNVHLWNKMCTSTIDSLRLHPLFPLWPSVRGQPEMPNELVSIMSSMWSAQRVMGLLHPPSTGNYRFEIKSHTISEFWLSTNQDPKNAVMLARNNKNMLFGVSFAKGPLITKSNPVNLKRAEPVYFEIIHGINDVSGDQVQVRWLIPGAHSYTGIPKTSLSTIIDNDSSLDDQTRNLVLQSASLKPKENPVEAIKPYTWKNKNFSKSFDEYPLTYTKENLHTAKMADPTKIMDIFSVCEYAPSYVIKKKYPRYRGVENTYYSDVFPDDTSWNKIWKDCERAHLCQGNKIVEESVVVDVVNLFMKQLDAKYPGEYKLANVINMELNPDEKRGTRFFLELILFEVKTKELQRLSQYLYQLKDSKTLCRPKGMVWSPNVKINAVVTAKNQGAWIVQYVKNMAKVIHETNDQNVNFVISDYGNNGVNVEEELIRNGLTNYTVIKMNGKFHKTQAIHDAVKSIKDQDSIVFLTDLHLEAPNSLFESVRKHTIQGILGFTPVVFRLTKCARPETDQTPTTGFWDGYAFGIISFFKSDWDVFGGVNIKEYKNSWGGEDWEMVDRVLEKGYEVDRLRLPFFYHFNHDKSGMWDKA